jgi:hypothetical protein
MTDSGVKPFGWGTSTVNPGGSESPSTGQLSAPPAPPDPAESPPEDGPPPLAAPPVPPSSRSPELHAASDTHNQNNPPNRPSSRLIYGE